MAELEYLLLRIMGGSPVENPAAAFSISFNACRRCLIVHDARNLFPLQRADEAQKMCEYNRYAPALQIAFLQEAIKNNGERYCFV